METVTVFCYTVSGFEIVYVKYLALYSAACIQEEAELIKTDYQRRQQ